MCADTDAVKTAEILRRHMIAALGDAAPDIRVFGKLVHDRSSLLRRFFGQEQYAPFSPDDASHCVDFFTAVCYNENTVGDHRERSDSVEFTYDGRSYPVILERKRVKNINLHVRTDGSIYVSAARHVPEAVILAFLEKNAARFTAASDSIREKRRNQELSDGAAVAWLGEKLYLKWNPKPCPTVHAGDTLTVFARTPEEAAYAFRQWRETECLALFRQLNDEVHAAFRAAGYAVPHARIEVKDMTSRWGSCTAAKGRISINIRLMQYPLGCIRGVFYHEYAHFLHQNHSAAFYAVLRRMYPDYDRYDAILKAI